MSHFPSQPPLQLPSIPSLQQHLSRFGAPPNNNNFTGIHIGNLNSGREFDQWQRSHHQQQQQQPPFIVAGLEPPTAATYPENLPTEANNFGAAANTSTTSLQYNNCHQQLQNLTSFSIIPMKNEEQNQNHNQEREQEQGIMLSNFLRPADQNSHFWGGDHQNSWTDLSALSSSSSSHLL